MPPRSLILRGSLIAAIVAAAWGWKASAGHRPAWLDRSVSFVTTGPAWLTDRRVAIFAALVLLIYLGVAAYWYVTSRRRVRYDASLGQFAAVVLAGIVLLVAAGLALACWMSHSLAIRWIAFMTTIPLVQAVIALIIDRYKAARKRRA